MLRPPPIHHYWYHRNDKFWWEFFISFIGHAAVVESTQKSEPRHRVLCSICDVIGTKAKHFLKQTCLLSIVYYAPNKRREVAINGRKASKTERNWIEIGSAKREEKARNFASIFGVKFLMANTKKNRKNRDGGREKGEMRCSCHICVMLFRQPSPNLWRNVNEKNS